IAGSASRNQRAGGARSVIRSRCCRARHVLSRRLAVVNGQRNSSLYKTNRIARDVLRRHLSVVNGQRNSSLYKTNRIARDVLSRRLAVVHGRRNSSLYKRSRISWCRVVSGGFEERSHGVAVGGRLYGLFGYVLDWITRLGCAGGADSALV